MLNRIRAHKGVDYAARSGTPIKTTGDGKIIYRGRKGVMAALSSFSTDKNTALSMLTCLAIKKDKNREPCKAGTDYWLCRQIGLSHGSPSAL